VTERTPRRAYLDLQKLARDQGCNTQQLFELYVHERFLARLAESRFADKLVLKGGMLLAVLDVRRGTRDADMLARGLANDEGSLRGAIGEIASIPMVDGVEFDTTAISVATIREGADYEGIRLTLPASLGGAELKLRLDLSFGDPVEPRRIDYPTLLGDPRIPLLGYALESVIAEKVDTMIFLGDANTRDRDYGDVYLLSQIHPVEAEALRDALRSVAEHRGHEVRPLGGRFSKSSAGADSSPGKRSALAPVFRVCRSVSPMSSMRWSTSSTGCRTRTAGPGIQRCGNGSRTVGRYDREAQWQAVQRAAGGPT
jgi:hypothetical protein